MSASSKPATREGKRNVTKATGSLRRLFNRRAEPASGSELSLNQLIYRGVSTDWVCGFGRLGSRECARAGLDSAVTGATCAPAAPARAGFHQGPKSKSLIKLIARKTARPIKQSEEAEAGDTSVCYFSGFLDLGPQRRPWAGRVSQRISSGGCIAIHLFARL